MTSQPPRTQKPPPTNLTTRSISSSQPINLSNRSETTPTHPSNTQPTPSTRSVETTNILTDGNVTSDITPLDTGNDGDDPPAVPNSNSNPSSPIVIPDCPAMLSREKIDKQLFECKKINTKLIKTTHHTQFLQQCQKECRIPNGLQLKLQLNVVDGDISLLSKIKGILLQAEIEIVEELTDHYQELTDKLQNQAAEVQDTLKSFEEQNNQIKETYQESKKETDILEQKLRTRRDNKIKRIQNHEERIEQLKKDNTLNPRRQRQQWQSTNQPYFPSCSYHRTDQTTNRFQTPQWTNPQPLYMPNYHHNRSTNPMDELGNQLTDIVRSLNQFMMSIQGLS